MNASLKSVSQKIQEIIEEKGTITLTELEHSVNASFNLLFLAIECMVNNNKVSLKRSRRDYLISWVNPKNKLVLNEHCMD